MVPPVSVFIQEKPLFRVGRRHDVQTRRIHIHTHTSIRFHQDAPGCPDVFFTLLISNTAVCILTYWFITFQC